MQLILMMMITIITITPPTIIIIIIINKFSRNSSLKVEKILGKEHMHTNTQNLNTTNQ